MGDVKKSAEIEITPEMVEAGYEALEDFDGGYMDCRHERVMMIYRAMEAVRMSRVVSPRVCGDLPE